MIRFCEMKCNYIHRSPHSLPIPVIVMVSPLVN